MKTWFLLMMLSIAGNAQAQNFIRAYNYLPFSGPSGVLLPYDCVRFNDGRYVMTGHLGYIWETDAQGIPLSTHTIIEGDLPVGNWISYQYSSIAGNNEIYIAGLTSADSAFIIKLNLETGIVWQKGYALAGSYMNGIQTTQDGGVILVANSDRGDTQNAIPVLTKIDANGTLIWQKRYFNSNPDIGRMRWQSISLASNGDILLAGVNAEPSPFKIGITRLNSAGETLWSKTLDASNNGNEIGISLSETANGELQCVMGNPEAGYYIATGNLSADGDWMNGKLWSGFSSTPRSAHVFTNNTTIDTFTNSGEILYMDGENNPIFANNYSIPDMSSTVWTSANRFNETNLALFGGYTLSFFGDFNALMMTMPQTGEVASGFSTALSVSSEAYNPNLQDAEITDSIGPGLFETNLSYFNLPLIYDTLFANNPTVIMDRVVGSDISIFPNPASKTVQIVHQCSDCMVDLINQQGQIIQNLNNNGPQLELQVEHMPSGIYYIRLQSAKGDIETRKLILSD